MQYSYLNVGKRVKCDVVKIGVYPCNYKFYKKDVLLNGTIGSWWCGMVVAGKMSAFRINALSTEMDIENNAFDAYIFVVWLHLILT